MSLELLRLTLRKVSPFLDPQQIAVLDGGEAHITISGMNNTPEHMAVNPLVEDLLQHEREKRLNFSVRGRGADQKGGKVFGVLFVELIGVPIRHNVAVPSSTSVGYLDVVLNLNPLRRWLAKAAIVATDLHCHRFRRSRGRGTAHNIGDLLAGRHSIHVSCNIRAGRLGLCACCQTNKWQKAKELHLFSLRPLGRDSNDINLIGYAEKFRTLGHRSIAKASREAVDTGRLVSHVRPPIFLRQRGRTDFPAFRALKIDTHLSFAPIAVSSRCLHDRS